MAPQYNLPGFQAEPEAAFWLEGPNHLCVPKIQQIIGYTEPPVPLPEPRASMFVIDRVRDFPDTPSEFLCQFVELVQLWLTRDKALPVADPAVSKSAVGVAQAGGFSGVAEAFSTDEDAFQAGRLAESFSAFLQDSVRQQILAVSAELAPAPAGEVLGRPGRGDGGAQSLADADVLEAARTEGLSDAVARFGRRCRARVSPLSAFLQLQPAPFGAVFNVARPGSQIPVTNVLTQDQRIASPPAVILTGRELARAFENETPGLYHRHALNWLLFNRADVSPPRHARVWAALDMAIYGALGAAWHYKWHRAPFRYLQRPWEYAHVLDVLFDREVNSAGSGDGAPRTCPTPSPGTPRHPAWPSGHATYSAAASYILEYFFVGEASLGRTFQQVLQAAQNAAAQGAPPFGPDWIALHLRLLANNIAEARLFGGVHWRDDSDAGQKIGRAAAQVVIDQLKADCVPDFTLRSCPAGAGVMPPDPVALAAATRAARATACPIDQDRIER